MVPVGYNIWAKQADDARTTPTVKLTSLRSHNMASLITTCHGDEAGTGGGVKSGTHNGVCEPLEHSSTVRTEGKNAIRHNDLWWMNNKNTIGKCVLTRSTAINQLPQPNPSEAVERRKKALQDRVDQLKAELQANKGSWNPYDWMRDSLRQESLVNAQSQLSDLQSGTTRGVLNQINDGVVAAGDSIIEGAEGAAKGVWNAGSGAVNFVGAGLAGDDAEAARIGNAGVANVQQAYSGAVNTLSNPSGWFQGTRDAWNAGNQGAAIGGIAPDVAGAAGLAKAGLKKLGGALAKDGAEAGGLGTGTRGLRVTLPPPPIASYKELRKKLKGQKLQANHLNQDAAFRDKIPKSEGAANGMEGNAFTDVGSPHYELNKSLEGFWDAYREGGDLEGMRPTVGEYDAALRNALSSAGYDGQTVDQLANYVAANRTAY